MTFTLARAGKIVRPTSSARGTVSVAFVRKRMPDAVRTTLPAAIRLVLVGSRFSKRTVPVALVSSVRLPVAGNVSLTATGMLTTLAGHDAGDRVRRGRAGIGDDRHLDRSDGLGSGRDDDRRRRQQEIGADAGDEDGQPEDRRPDDPGVGSRRDRAAGADACRGRSGVRAAGSAGIAVGDGRARRAADGLADDGGARPPRRRPPPGHKAERAVALRGLDRRPGGLDRCGRRPAATGADGPRGGRRAGPRPPAATPGRGRSPRPPGDRRGAGDGGGRRPSRRFVLEPGHRGFVFRDRAKTGSPAEAARARVAGSPETIESRFSWVSASRDRSRKLIRDVATREP